MPGWLNIAVGLAAVWGAGLSTYTAFMDKRERWRVRLQLTPFMKSDGIAVEGLRVDVVNRGTRPVSVTEVRLVSSDAVDWDWPFLPQFEAQPYSPCSKVEPGDHQAYRLALPAFAKVVGEESRAIRVKAIVRSATDKERRSKWIVLDVPSLLRADA
jgi:hypothetical protein